MPRRKHGKRLAPATKNIQAYNEKIRSERQGLATFLGFEKMTTDDLLSKCVKGRTQNVNEAFNSKVWAKCPKIRLHGKDSATCAYHLAAIDHNIGYKAGSLLPFMKQTTKGTAKTLLMKEKKRKSTSMCQPKKRKRAVQEQGENYKPGGF